MQFDKKPDLAILSGIMILMMNLTHFTCLSPEAFF